MRGLTRTESKSIWNWNIRFFSVWCERQMPITSYPPARLLLECIAAESDLPNYANPQFWVCSWPVRRWELVGSITLSELWSLPSSVCWWILIRASGKFAGDATQRNNTREARSNLLMLGTFVHMPLPCIARAGCISTNTVLIFKFVWFVLTINYGPEDIEVGLWAKR